MDLKELSEQIKNNLTIEQVKDLLYTFDAEPIIKNDIIISRTICHCGNSHKLYYYNNTHLFKCFTDCSEMFDIYDLIRKVKKAENQDLSLYQSILYLTNFFNINLDFTYNDKNDNLIKDWKILKQYENNYNNEEEIKKIELKIYDPSILKFLPHFKLPMWLNEGISQEVIDYNNICFNPLSWGIVIPHYNINGELVGIRERTLIKEEENNGKYKPAILNYKMYNHQLGFNLYNLNNSKNNIKKIKKAIIGEGEKFCLMYASFFGIDNDISVAVCGSNITKYQIELLLKLDVEEIIIAFDKQFKEIGDEEFKLWVKKLKEINKKISPYTKISFMFDKWNLLEYKMSPIDNGKEIFLELYNKRIYV